MDPIASPSNYFPKMMMMDNYIDQLDWLNVQDQPSVKGECEEHPPVLENYVDYQSQLLPNGINHHQPSYFLQDFDDICADFGMWEFNQNANNSMCMAVDGNIVNALDHGNNSMIGNTNYYSSSVSSNNTRAIKRQRGRQNKSNPLELDEIKKCFHLPIIKAAKKLNVGLTVLKKRCRELNVMRWPHRKIKSLESLIDNVKGMGLSYEVAMLEEHKRLLEEVPELELTEETKKLRQACFKATYNKKRRSMSMQQTINNSASFYL